MPIMKKIQSELIAAAYSGNLEEVKKLVAKPECDPDKPDNFKGSTPLHWACRGGHLNVAQWLVEEAGADPAFKNQDGRAPLFFACDGCHDKVIEWLVGSCGADVNVKDNIDGQTPLHRVCSAGIVRGISKAINVLNFLVKEGRADVAVTDNGGKFPEQVTELLPVDKWKGKDLGVGYVLKKARDGPEEPAVSNVPVVVGIHSYNNKEEPAKIYKEEVRVSPERSSRNSSNAGSVNVVRKFSNTNTAAAVQAQNQPSSSNSANSKGSKVKSLTAAFEQQNASNVEPIETSRRSSYQTSLDQSHEAPTEDAPTEDEPDTGANSTFFSRIKFFNRK